MCTVVALVHVQASCSLAPLRKTAVTKPASSKSHVLCCTCHVLKLKRRKSCRCCGRGLFSCPGWFVQAPSKLVAPRALLYHFLMQKPLFSLVNCIYNPLVSMELAAGQLTLTQQVESCGASRNDRVVDQVCTIFFLNFFKKKFLYNTLPYVKSRESLSSLCSRDNPY